MLRGLQARCASRPTCPGWRRLITDQNSPDNAEVPTLFPNVCRFAMAATILFGLTFATLLIMLAMPVSYATAERLPLPKLV